MSIKLREHIEEVISISDEEFEFILPHFKFRKFRRRQFIIQEGDLVKNDYFILSGLVRSYSNDQKGKTHIISIATENWWLSDPSAYHNQTEAVINADCLEDTETLSLSLLDREKLCSELRKMEHFFLKKTTAGYIAAQKRILSLISFSASELYEYLLQQYPGILNRVPKSVVASYLGISRETLSRLTSKP